MTPETGRGALRRRVRIGSVLLALVMVTLASTALDATRTPALADAPKPTAMVLVMDASGSMNEPDGHGSTKLAAAKNALRTIVGQLPDDLSVGLRVFGATIPSKPDHARACQDSQLVAPVTRLNRSALTAAVNRYAAKGETPIGLALQRAAADLPAGTEGSIVLVSDGEDSCAPPVPCEVAQKIKASGIRLTVDTVGLKVNSTARTQLTCISQTTGGTYTDVTDTSQLASRLSSVTQQAARGRRDVAGGRTVEGGTTLGTAPTLSNGRYSDSIVAGETLYWGVGVDPGQTVTARATVDATRARSDTSYLSVDTAFTDETGSNQATNSTSIDVGKVGVAGVSLRAKYANTERVTVYFAVKIDHLAPGSSAPLTIEIVGSQPAASAPPGSTGAAAGASTPAPSATVSTAPGGPGSGSGESAAGGGLSLPLVAGGGAGGLLAGTLAGFAIGRATRRRVA